ncbi:helix-turn-helix domain-containing protein [Sulfurospirillum arsenophilum]|uniref:helix-turn-helix domain-containing protein n=1 Tax=Sulfurospirillum arsenophilum TaxID=56698 RepID=UPI0006932BC7|nr:helix-turn-helix domain-containing protein [Sulfurospirillum arsenophilum]
MISKHNFDKKELKIIGFLSLLFFIFLLVNHALNYKLLKETIQAYENTILARVDGKLADWVNERFSNIEKIERFLEKSDINSKNELQKSLKRIQETSNFPYIIMGLDDGTFLISEDNFVTPKEYDPRRREWYVDTLKMGKTIVSKPYVSMRLSLPAVSVCTPIDIFGGIGVVCGGQPFEVIQQYISSYDILYDKALYLVDENGIVLASSNHQKNAPSFLHVNTLSDDFLVMKIANTNWNLVFEKNQAIYSERLNIQLLMNLLIYGGSIALYILLNLFWLSKNRKVEHELIKQKDYFHNFMQHHTLRGVMICDSSAKVIFCNQTFSQFLQLKEPMEDRNFYDTLQMMTTLEPSVKRQIIALIAQTQESLQAKYLNISKPENPTAQLLLTSAPFGSKETNNNSFLLSLQDTTEMQPINDEEQKVSGDIVFNAHIEKLLMFIEKNLDDERLDINKLAHVCGYSKYHLQRIFKQYCGENIASYLRRLRMEKSAFLLKYSEEKISVIAALCGFGYNQSYIRAFEKYYALSPNDFRDTHISDMHNSMLFERSEYEMIQHEKLCVLNVYNTLKENAPQCIEDLLDKCLEGFNRKISLSGIYVNDPKISLKEEGNIAPYAFGIILETCEYQSTRNLPIRIFEAGKYAKIAFDPRKDDLEIFIQKIYFTFYKSSVYHSGLLSILQLQHNTHEHYLEDIAQPSDFLVYLGKA